ncbi:hypothetical protein I552_0877 [Mycobacterium xenopi 3993]|nr:hypothetical protein I552_0877 [Mycobacterium xenopi 3993]
MRVAQDHLAAARRNTLAFGTDKTIEAKLIGNTGLDFGLQYNGRPGSRKESGR